MDKIIKEKVNLFTKIVLSLGCFAFLFFLYDFTIRVLNQNYDNEYLSFVILFIFLGFPVMVGWGIVMFNSATELTAVDDTITVKLAFRKPVVIPLENIKRIDTWGDVKRSRHFFLIKSEEKNFNTLLFTFNFRDFNAFMEELIRRRDITMLKHKK